MTSGKRAVITHLNGKGRLDGREDVMIGQKGRIMNNNYMATPGIESRVSGRIGFPPSSFRAEIFAAHRTVALLRKSELFAINRPTQILEPHLDQFYAANAPESYGPLSEALKNKRNCDQHNRSKRFVGALQMIHVLACVDRSAPI